MRSRNRFVLIVLSVAIVLALCLYGANQFANHLEDRWLIKYGVFDKRDVDNEAARSAAQTMRWFSPSWSAFYLGHMAVSDSITLTGEAKRAHLAEALARLEGHRFPDRALSDVDYLKAALAAMLGDRVKTIRYATEGCVNSRPATPDPSCIAKYNYVFRLGDAYHSRWSAVQLYEDVKIIEVTGGLDRDDLRLGETVALIHFDMSKARQLRDALIRDDALTGQRREDYCETMRFREKDATDKAVCGADPRKP